MATAYPNWLTFEGISFSSKSFSWAWLFALAAYGVGDVVTTIALVYFSPLHVEANPVIAGAIALFGGGGFLALKLLVFYAAIGVSIWAGALEEDRLLFYGPPVLLGVIGFATTAFNFALLL